MKKGIVIAIILFVFQGFCQEKFEIRNLGFSMNAPKDWLEVKNEAVLENLERFDLTEDQKDKLLKSNSSDLIAYMKYDTKKYSGIVPTVKIRTLPTNSKTIAAFSKEIENLTEEVGGILDNFRFSKKPVAVKVSDKDALDFEVQFTMKTGGKEYNIISHSYYILFKGYFISLNFIEQLGKEDNTKLFEELFQSIEITK